MRGGRRALALSVALVPIAVPAAAASSHERAAPTTASVARAVAAHFAPLGAFSGPWLCRSLGRSTGRCAGTAVAAQAMDTCNSLLPCEVVVTVSWTHGQLHFARLRAA
jgi:hypothetical protein